MTVTLTNAFAVPPEQDAAFVKSWKLVAGVLSAERGYLDAVGGGIGPRRRAAGSRE